MRIREVPYFWFIVAFILVEAALILIGEALL